jgi:hypothetical protein
MASETVINVVTLFFMGYFAGFFSCFLPGYTHVMASLGVGFIMVG